MLTDVVQEIARLATAGGGKGRYKITALPAAAGGKPPGETPLLHFMYKSPSRGQYIAPAWTCPLDNEGFQKVRPSFAAWIMSLVVLQGITSIYQLISAWSC